MKALLKTLKTNLVTMLRPTLRVEVVQGDFNPQADHVVVDLVLAGFGHGVVIPSRSLYNVKLSKPVKRLSRREFKELYRQLREDYLLEMIEYRRVDGPNHVNVLHCSHWNDAEASRISKPGEEPVFLQDVAPTR